MMNRNKIIKLVPEIIWRLNFVEDRKIKYVHVRYVAYDVCRRSTNTNTIHGSQICTILFTFLLKLFFLLHNNFRRRTTNKIEKLKIWQPETNRKNATDLDRECQLEWKKRQIFFLSNGVTWIISLWLTNHWLFHKLKNSTFSFKSNILKIKGAYIQNDAASDANLHPSTAVKVQSD